VKHLRLLAAPQQEDPAYGGVGDPGAAASVPGGEPAGRGARVGGLGLEDEGAGGFFEKLSGSEGAWRAVLCKRFPPLPMAIRCRSNRCDRGFHSFHGWAGFHLIRSLLL
jgi:hypothetical protein